MKYSLELIRSFERCSFLHFINLYNLFRCKWTKFDEDSFLTSSVINANDGLYYLANTVCQEESPSMLSNTLNAFYNGNNAVVVCSFLLDKSLFMVGNMKVKYCAVGNGIVSKVNTNNTNDTQRFQDSEMWGLHLLRYQWKMKYNVIKKRKKCSYTKI